MSNLNSDKQYLLGRMPVQPNQGESQYEYK